MSAFDTLLDLLSMEVNVFYNGAMCGDWVVEDTHQGQTIFHWVTLSKAHLSVDGDKDLQGIPLYEGDLIILPKEIPHQIRSLPTDEPSGVQAQMELSYPKESQEEPVQFAGMLCGAVHFSHVGSQSFMDALPKVLIVRNGGQWVKPLLTLLYAESETGAQKSSSIINKLAELVFCHAIRWHLEKNPKDSGVLSLYVEPVFSPLLEEISLHPGKDWNLESMAAVCALSRTVFATRFKALSGWTPNRYLVWLRMQMAWSFLEKGEATSIVAEKVGYFSDAAFSRVFLKEFGRTPSKVRKGIL